MVMRAYFKTVRRTIRNNFARFLAITLIITLGIAFISGVGTLAYKMRRALESGYQTANSPDVIIKCTLPTGISTETVQAISNASGTESVQAVSLLEFRTEEDNLRIYVTDLSDQKINRLTLTEGRYPENGNETVVERPADTGDVFAVGDKITLLGEEKTVGGVVANAMLSYRGGEIDQTEGETLDRIAYLDSAYFPGVFPVTDLYVTFHGISAPYLTDGYDDEVDARKDALEQVVSDESVVFLTLRDTMSYALAQSYEEKVNLIASIFPVFFIAVSALVVLTTMSRLIEEERAVIGCYRTLGYGNGKIAFKYLFFSLLCCLFGDGIGLAIGFTFLPWVIFPGFNSFFFLPDWGQWLNPAFGLIAAAAMLFVVCGVTFYLIRKELRASPAEILRPKAPKAGKKIFLEHIPFIWKPLSFRYKSTFRNIFRYGKHLLMTVVSVAGSTAIVLAGIGLSDVSNTDAIRDTYANMAESVSAISLVIILFAALLCVLVIYNLTNMNIAERQREIATLKVLGYHHREVCGYIFREVVIMGLMGIFVGIPLGYFLMRFAFSYLEFGSVADVNWYSYPIAALFVTAVILAVDLILRRKIRKIDMTSSLKTVE